MKHLLLTDKADIANLVHFQRIKIWNQVKRVCLSG